MNQERIESSEQGEGSEEMKREQMDLSSGGESDFSEATEERIFRATGSF
jgi:hypothetical protein